MLILIEGSDGTGKTTLANYLCKELGAHYLHATFDLSWNIFNYHTRLLYKAIRLIIKTNKPVVIDRLWLSEAIYAEVHRGGSQWGLQGRFIEKVLNRVGGIHILCLTENHVEYNKRFKRLKKDRTEMFDNVAEVVKLYNAVYWGNAPRNLFKAKKKPSYIDTLIHGEGMMNHINTIKYTIEEFGNDLYEYSLLVKERLNLVKPSYPLINHFQIFNGVGSPKFSTHLFIGDIPNPKGKKQRVLWPFYEYANSSLYFSKILNDLEIREENIFIVNINWESGIEMIECWLEYKMIQEISPKIICLGNNAERSFQNWFSQNIGSHWKNINYFKTCHPQAANRFPKYNRAFGRDLRSIFKGGKK